MNISRRFNAAAAALGILLGGTGIVPASAADSSLSDTKYAEVVSVSIDKDTIRVGETAQISLEWSSETDEKPTVYFDVLEFERAEVSGKGVVKGTMDGTVTIIVHVNTQRFTVELTVLPAISGNIGDSITWEFNEAEETLTIEGEGPLSFKDSYAPWSSLHKQIKKVVIGEGITNIPDESFPICTKLQSIVIPASVEEIDPLSMIILTSLTDIEVSPDNKNFTSADGILFSKDKTELLKYPANRADEEFTVPEGTKRLGETAFTVCRNLKSVTIPDSVTDIAENFIQCSVLENASIPKNIENIDGRCFERTPWLAAQQEKSPLVVINDHILLNGNTCTGEAVIPDMVDKIASYAFAGNEELKAVTFNSSVSIIPEMTFYGCTALESIDLPNNITSVGAAAFADSGLKTITIPANVSYIGEDAFSNCESLSDITILDPDCEIFDSKATISNVAKTSYPSKITTIEYNGVIRGYTDSTAQKYAEKYGYSFESLGDAPDKDEIIYGDSNCDGNVDISDAVYIMQALANPDKYAFGGDGEENMSEKGMISGDCYKPGSGLTAMDALTIQRYLLGSIDSLPVEE